MTVRKRAAEGGPMPEVVDIDEESKKHEDEWVLFEVTEADEMNRPVKGRLLCHSKCREEIHQVAMKCGKNHLRIAFTGDPVPPGMVAIL